LYDNISVVDNTAIYEVPTDRDIVAPISGHAVMDDSDDETETCTCELESECPVVTAEEALESFQDHYSVLRCAWF
jgi:hypothetical protein